MNKCSECEAVHGAWVKRSRINPRSWVECSRATLPSTFYSGAVAVTVGDGGKCMQCAERELATGQDKKQGLLF